MITLITEPTVIPLAHMQLIDDGLKQLYDWVRAYRPECLPDDANPMSLFPHLGVEDQRQLTGNELLAELAGRNCYHSYGLKAGRKSNEEYIAHTQSGTIPHKSIVYHPKMSFFIAGISRRVSHELIRHYVGADRSEEGSPSQESTRYTFHPGHFAVPPHVLEAQAQPTSRGIDAHVAFQTAMERAYSNYLAFINQEEEAWEAHHGEKPKAIKRKRIYEAAAGLLPMQACTSLVWTTNPSALAKLFHERCDEAADREFQRLAIKWRSIAYEMWPNLFPGRQS